MKIAITGGTAGIGKAIYDWFESRGHMVINFSRSTGHDLAEIDTVRRISEEAADCDVFINNAHHGFAQINLLYAFYYMWKDSPKLIVNISSRASDGNRSVPHPYCVQKAALDKATEQLQHIVSTCKIANIRPAYVATDQTKNIGGMKLMPAYVAELVGWVVDQGGIVLSLTVAA